MAIENRLKRIEQAVDARLAGLVRTDEEMSRHYEFLRRVADYAGFPIPTGAEMIAQWRDHDQRSARLMFAGSTVSEAAHSLCLEDARAAHCDVTAEQVEAAGAELEELRAAVTIDMESGKPASQSDAAARLRALMMQ